MQFSVSVIIPTFDRPVETVAAVESALDQTEKPAQILVIDDGSSDDNRQQLVRSMAALPVKLVLEPHCGHPGRVRNSGLKHVDTTHVAFLDSDDLWVPDKLAMQRELAESGTRAQGSSYRVKEGASVPVELSGRAPISLSLRQLLQENIICNSSVLIETELLYQIGGLPISYGVRGIEDYAAWLRVACLTEWMYLEAPLVLYADSPELSMRSTNYFSTPERVLALWDFVAWLNEQGRPTPLRVKLGLQLANYKLRKWAARQARTQNYSSSK